MSEPTLPPIIDPGDPCQDDSCSRINGRCVGYHCQHCGRPSSMFGHTDCQERAWAQRCTCAGGTALLCPVHAEEAMELLSPRSDDRESL